MSEFTKGPWVKTVNANGCVFVTHTDMRRNGGRIIASISGKDEIANANLITSAPDMLEALEALTSMVERQLDFNDDGDGLTLSRCYETIAKAKGESQ